MEYPIVNVGAVSWGDAGNLFDKLPELLRIISNVCIPELGILIKIVRWFSVKTSIRLGVVLVLGGLQYNVWVQE